MPREDMDCKYLGHQWPAVYYCMYWGGSQGCPYGHKCCHLPEKKGAS